ncbi:serine hydrolase domain-containing protein [Micromonospora sp. NPDC007208]|uniref:serine hydrolase domain-containing protein n=1 Tax=Micromonospora sp. NPDC007208 TaxID=3364236 RepID=UPI0036BAD87C
MTDLDLLVRRTAERLARRGVGAVAAAVTADSVVVHGAGSTGGPAPTVPDASTVFEIGSITKIFTALALARLSLAGTVSLDEPLQDLLPPGASVPTWAGAEITLSHLATHTAGLPRLPAGLLRRALTHPGHPDPYRDCTTDRLLAGLARTRLRSRPGRRFRYSNLGMGLLGLALARRVGTTYETLVTDAVCRPLALDDTGVTVDADRLAQGHSARRRPTPRWNLAALVGAGGLCSTAGDLALLLRAHLRDGGELAEATALCQRIEHRVDGSRAVHLGWLSHRPDLTTDGPREFWHSGTTGGYAAYLAFDPQNRTGVLALSNTARSVHRPAVHLHRDLRPAPGAR